MITIPIERLLALALVLLLTGCGTTTPTNYYLLSAPEGDQPGSQSPALGIGPIEIPEYLNRHGLVYNRQGNQLQIANYERWAEPLADGVERVVGLNLASLLNTGNVQSFPWHRSSPPEYGVRVAVLQLDAGDSGATLIAEWELRKPGNNTLLIRRITRLHEPGAAGQMSPEQIAPLYSNLFYQLSETIAQHIRTDLDATED
jgi:uncharacterized protein